MRLFLHHPSFQLAGLMICTTLLLPGCGGGGGADQPADAAPAPGPGPAQTPVADCGLPDFQATLLRLVNERRARGAVCGAQSLPAAPVLRWNTALANAAQRHSQDMADRGFFDHQGSDGSHASQRITASGYAWSSWGENIAVGQRSAEAVIQAWMQSEGHCRNIMAPRYQDMGLACVRPANAPSGFLWTQVLASP